MEMSKLSVPTLDAAEPGSGVVYQRGTGSFSQMLVQPDGKVLVLGAVPGTFWPAPALSRFNADGSLDRTFAADAIPPNVLMLGGESQAGVALMLDPGSGDILAVTSASGGVMVFRVTAEGEPAPGWDLSGVWLPETENQSFFGAEGIRVTSEGDLVIAATRYDFVKDTWYFALERLLSDGTLDADFKPAEDIVGRLTIFAELSGQHMLVGGVRGEGERAVGVLARLDDEGARDTAWGTQGVLELPVAGFMPLEVQVQADGRILLAGYFAGAVDALYGTQDYSFALMRLLPDGRLDTSFGADGPKPGLIRQIDGAGFNWDGYASVDPSISLSINDAGEILWTLPNDSGLTLVRLDSSGEPDDSFNAQGSPAGVQRVELPVEPVWSTSRDPIQAILGAEGEILFGTSFGDPAVQTLYHDVFLGRLTPEGLPAPDFGLPAGWPSGTYASDVLPSTLGDHIDGYGGLDWVDYEGRLADYRIEADAWGGGSWRIEGADDFSQLLSGIGRLRFDDAIVAPLAATQPLALVRVLWGEEAAQDRALLGKAFAYVDALSLNTVLQILLEDGTLAAHLGDLSTSSLLGEVYTRMTGEVLGDADQAALRAELGFSAPHEDRTLVDNLYWLLSSTPMRQALQAEAPADYLVYERREDIVVATSADDVLWASAGGSRLDGAGGIDEVLFDAVRSRFSIERLEDGGLRVDGGTHGVTELIHVERLRFADGVRAFDLAPDESAGQAARLLAALAGAEALHSPLNLIGQAITLVDRLGAEGTARTVVNNGVVADLAGGDSLDALIGLLHRNLTGSAPTQAELDWTLDWAQSQQLDAAELLLFAADLPQVAELIGVDELARDGLAYYPAFNLG